MFRFRKRRFTVEGLNIERLIAGASDAGVHFSSVSRAGSRRIEGIVYENDLATLRSFAQAGGWKLDEGRCVGFARLEEAIRRHSALACCLLLACTMLAVCAGWIWRIDITGSELYKPDILVYLKRSGINPPIARSAIDTDQLEDALQWRYPNVGWIECALRGVTLEIRIHEGIPQGQSVTVAGSGDVTAARGGVITQVVTTAGTPLVVPGQTVRVGDVLICGEERQKDGTVTQVKAGGQVMARVWDAASASIPLMQTESTYTGAVFETLTVSLPWFRLWEQDEPPYENYDEHVSVMPLGGVFLPIWVSRTTAHEYQPSVTAMPASEAQKAAADAAYIRLLRKTGYDDDFVDKWVEYSMIEDEIVCASAYGERIIDIAAAAQP